jgi:sigma-B regulation protein RsbQ
VGGFSRQDIDSLLDTLDTNYLGWASSMAPAIMGAPDQPELGQELKNSFCATDPEIAKHFARVTFLSDNRADLPKLKTRSLILQCSDDMIAPMEVGRYMHRAMPNSTLKIIQNIGHCPHLSAPLSIATAMREFL